MLFSVQDIMDLGPCYSYERVKRIFNEKEKLSFLEILDLEIPEKDRLWVALKLFPQAKDKLQILCISRLLPHLDEAHITMLIDGKVQPGCDIRVLDIIAEMKMETDLPYFFSLFTKFGTHEEEKQLKDLREIYGNYQKANDSKKELV